MSTDKKKNGFVLLDRQIRDHWTWTDKPFGRGQAWIDLIMSAGYEAKTIMFDGKPLKLRRGEFVTSIRKLATSWGWSQGKVSRFLNALESEDMITQKRSTKRIIVFIVNYGIYQGSRSSKRSTDGALTEHRRSTDGDNETNTKNINKGKEVCAPRIDLWGDVKEEDLIK